jgi:hypothetical protein
MVKIFVKIVLAALVVHACWRATNVFLRYYKFKDGVHETVLFSSGKPDSVIEERVLELAHELDVPVRPENVSVRRVDNRTIIDANYTDRIEFVPTKFYPWQFKVNVESFNAYMPSSNDVTAPGR